MYSHVWLCFTTANSPLQPSELLVALHAIDCNEDDTLMKAVIKGEYSKFTLIVHTHTRARARTHTHRAHIPFWLLLVCCPCV